MNDKSWRTSLLDFIFMGVDGPFWKTRFTNFYFIGSGWACLSLFSFDSSKGLSWSRTIILLLYGIENFSILSFSESVSSTSVWFEFWLSCFFEALLCWRGFLIYLTMAWSSALCNSSLPLSDSTTFTSELILSLLPVDLTTLMDRLFTKVSRLPPPNSPEKLGTSPSTPLKHIWSDFYEAE